VKIKGPRGKGVAPIRVTFIKRVMVYQAGGEQSNRSALQESCHVFGKKDGGGDRRVTIITNSKLYVKDCDNLSGQLGKKAGKLSTGFRRPENKRYREPEGRVRG